ncbi:MAG: hypothetical protein M3R08_02640 [Bacteroidota bacterium]|nr:hypothetical protein [Bacteroidota bacterium]
MQCGKWNPVIAIWLGFLFTFMLVPADLLHDHGAIEQHGVINGDLVESDCSICDPVLPVQPAPILIGESPVRSFLPIGTDALICSLYKRNVLQHSDRGPPGSI